MAKHLPAKHSIDNSIERNVILLLPTLHQKKKKRNIKNYAYFSGAKNFI